MDFAFTHEQEALRELARQILTDHITQERLKAVKASGEAIDREAWRELARAKLLGIPISEAWGGSGMDMTEVAIVLEEIGRRVAPVPYLQTVVMGAMPIARFGSGEQCRKYVLPVVAGESVLTAALVEPASDDPLNPATTARRVTPSQRRTGETPGWVLDGVKVCVSAAHLADRILVPARTGGEALGVFLVDPNAKGVSVERGRATNNDRWSRVELSGVKVDDGDVLGQPDGGREIVDWIVAHAIAGLCATELGVVAEALRITAEYVSKREQFGKPLASFQAVAQRAADAFIDVEAIRLTTWQAVWRLAQGVPSTEAILTAKFWAAEGGHRVAYACQHLHGGIGVDLDYPIHRYYTWSKAIELSLGSAQPTLARLGAVLAAQEV